MKYLFFCLSLVLALLCRAQSHSDTIRLYYSIGSTKTFPGLQKADSAIGVHSSGIISIAVYGYADFLGNAAANRHLSQLRANTVKQSIEKKYPHLAIIGICEGKGAQLAPQNPSPLGDPASRRVDVVLSYTVVLQKKDSVIPAPVAKAEVKKEEGKAQEKDITSLEVGETMAIKGINFFGGQHILVPHSKEPLLALLKTLKDNPSMKVEIQGHVCCTDSKADGLDTDTGSPNLSQNRARAIYNFLTENGIDKSRLRYKGFGHSKPLVWPEDSEEAREANRRVEIMILGK